MGSFVVCSYFFLWLSVLLNDFLNSFATIILNDIKKNKKSTTKQVYVCKENYIGIFCSNKLIMMLFSLLRLMGQKGLTVCWCQSIDLFRIFSCCLEIYIYIFLSCFWWFRYTLTVSNDTCIIFSIGSNIYM